MTNAQTFYAACIPPEERDTLSDFRAGDYVSEEKDKILSIARKHKGTRFKAFNRFEDALDFVGKDLINNDLSLSLNGFENSNSPSTENVSNKSSPLSSNQSSPSAVLRTELPLPFPALQTPKLSAFRRIIQQDKVDSVRDLIWSNPRYLINYTTDNPTIIYLSGHYNAVHIAVRTGAVKSLSYILKTIDSIEFIALAYPTANETELEEKRDRMLDLYLNTPDKCLNNSPLHFACSNGYIDCVRILLDYVPKCDIDYRNKEGRTCRDLVENNENGAKIISLFNDCMYVAIIRSNDELEYQVPLPCFGKKNLDNSFDSKNFHVSAIAGPMSPQCAKTLYRTISSPKHSTPEQREMRLRDPVRGVEKVVHKLTFEMDINFAQHWDFVGQCTSICSEEVLERLEDELHKKHDEATIADLFEKLSINQNNQGIDSPAQELNENTNGFDIDSTNNENDDNHEDDDQQDDYFTPPTSPLFDVLIRADKYFINSSKCQQLDKDVKEALEIAINNESLKLEDLKLNYPFTYYWFQCCVGSQSKNSLDSDKLSLKDSLTSKSDQNDNPK